MAHNPSQHQATGRHKSLKFSWNATRKYWGARAARATTMARSMSAARAGEWPEHQSRAKESQGSVRGGVELWAKRAHARYDSERRLSRRRGGAGERSQQKWRPARRDSSASVYTCPESKETSRAQKESLALEEPWLQLAVRAANERGGRVIAHRTSQCKPYPGIPFERSSRRKCPTQIENSPPCAAAARGGGGRKKR